MTPELQNYIIVRVHTNPHDLQKAVNSLSDYEPTGGPFRVEDAREWCQAMTLKRTAAPQGQVRLQEPAALAVGMSAVDKRLREQSKKR